MIMQRSRLAALATAALAVAGCALARTAAPAYDPPAPFAGPVTSTERGTVTVPIAMPALPDRAAQYVYSRNFINTIEVRLRDSYGTEQIQWVARNTYLAGSQASGTVSVKFYNVMQGAVVLTVRTSHIPLLSNGGPIKFDGLRDIFFLDLNGNSLYETNETEIRVLGGAKTDYFITFSDDSSFPGTILPATMRTDTTTAPLGFGLGGATGLVDPAGGTTTLAVNVGTAPQWGTEAFGIIREVTANETITLNVASGAGLQATDRAALSSTAPVNGLVDNTLAAFQALAFSATTSTSVSFKSTRSTSATTAAAPTAWGAWLMRGRAVGEFLTSTQVPQITVWPATASAIGSIATAQKDRVAASGTSKVQYDLRDAYGNLVAGNMTGQNSISIATAARDNAGLAVDFTTYYSPYSADASGLFPFILPGRTAPSLDGAGNLTQGNTAATPITTAATYSTTSANIKLAKLDVPYHIWNANQGSFPGGSHTYTLGVAASGPNFSVSLAKGGIVIASSSIASGLTGNLDLGAIPPTGNPAPQAPAVVAPVTLNTSVPLALTDDGKTFTVTSYGSRKIGDVDTVRMRVLKGSSVLFFKDLAFTW